MVGEEYQIVGNFIHPWCRYLDSLGSRSIRSRDDSLNSSDSEYTGSEEGGEARDHGRRRSKVGGRGGQGPRQAEIKGRREGRPGTTAGGDQR